MVGLECDRIGHGPRVVLVHGVGIGPWSFAALARDLAADHEVVVAHRRGYGASAHLAPGASLAQQVDDLAELAGGPAAFVGVSGGATLVLALALAAPDLARAAVVHEPVVGSLAPGLLAELRSAADELASSSGEAGALAFVRDLVGPQVWAGLVPEQVVDVASRAVVVRAEVPQFLAFSPDPAQLRGLAGGARLYSVGALSRSSRHQAAAAVAAYTGAPPTVLPGAGHLAQVEAPAALARALRVAERLSVPVARSPADLVTGGPADQVDVGLAVPATGDPVGPVHEQGPLEGRADGNEEVLAARGGDQLEPDG